MRKDIHGHEVLEMMLASGKAYGREELLAEIAGRFGPDARFHTCSTEGMTAPELVAFLHARGKIVEGPGGYTVDRAEICP